MGFVPSPPPLTEEQFKTKIAAGAETYEEFDPALAKWARSGIIGLINRKYINRILSMPIKERNRQ